MAAHIKKTNPELSFGELTSQKECGESTLPFPHVVTRFLKSDHGETQSEQYSGARYARTVAHEAYVDAGPTYKCHFFPRVYSSGTLALHVRPRVNAADDVLRFELSKLEHSMKKPWLPSVKDTSTGLLFLCAPTLKAQAVVQIHADLDDAARSRHWCLGWVQGCLEYWATCEYSNGGRITYELPRYGERCATEHHATSPWYSNAVLDTAGAEMPSQRTSGHPGVAICHDAVAEARSKGFPFTFYDGIEYSKAKDDDRSATVVGAHWRQKYRAWLVLKEKNSGSLYILRSITWWTERHYGADALSLTADACQSQTDETNYFMPESTFEGHSTLREVMEPVYSLPAWGDVKFSQLLAHRPAGWSSQHHQRPDATAQEKQAACQPQQPPPSSPPTRSAPIA